MQDSRKPETLLALAVAALATGWFMLRGRSPERAVARGGRKVSGKVRAFVSFDYDHDLDLKTLLVGQAKHPDTPFEIADWSIKEASADWKLKARSRIRSADQVIVICGEYTNTATGINEEIRIARSEKKPYFLLAGRANKPNRKPTAAMESDKMYRWTWENVKTLISGGR